jgi:hypothetical protein
MNRSKCSRVRFSRPRRSGYLRAEPSELDQDPCVWGLVVSWKVGCILDGKAGVQISDYEGEMASGLQGIVLRKIGSEWSAVNGSKVRFPSLTGRRLSSAGQEREDHVHSLFLPGYLFSRAIAGTFISPDGEPHFYRSRVARGRRGSCAFTSRGTRRIP